MASDLSPGDIVWVAPDSVVGREQGGRRPAIVVSGARYLEIIDSLAVIVPVTTVDRRWPNHVPVMGGELALDSWAMTEQVRAISRGRITQHAGRAADVTVAAIRVWLADYFEIRSVRRSRPRR